MGRLLASLALIGGLVTSAGCGLGPRNFNKITHPAPLVRARAMSLGYDRPDSVVLPALVERLDDVDPVVRLAAHEELKRRTGRDFGYLPWVDANDRAAAVGRWRSWLMGRPAERRAVPSRPRKSAPMPSPQVSQGF
jgi:hypothetical protein